MDDPTKGQVIQFIEKKPDPENPGQFVTVNDGTTNEEVLQVMINRFTELDRKMHSPYNVDAIAYLKAALESCNRRTAERKARGVEGTPKP